MIFCLLVWGRLCQSKMDAEAREIMIERKILFAGCQYTCMYTLVYVHAMCSRIVMPYRVQDI